MFFILWILSSEKLMAEENKMLASGGVAYIGCQNWKDGKKETYFFIEYIMDMLFN